MQSGRRQRQRLKINLFFLYPKQHLHNQSTTAFASTQKSKLQAWVDKNVTSAQP